MSVEVAGGLLSDQVAEEVRAMMARRRISGRELARKLDVSPSWVSYRLTGTQPIDLNDLQLIAAALGVEAVDLMPRRGDGHTVRFDPPAVIGSSRYLPGERVIKSINPAPDYPKISDGVHRRPIRLTRPIAAVTTRPLSRSGL